MSNDHNDKKIKSVGSTNKASEVEGANSVSGVGSVQGASSIAGVARAGAVGGARLTRAMSFEERAAILNQVEEETARLVKEGILPASKAGVVANALKMAIDSGLIPEEEKKK